MREWILSAVMMVMLLGLYLLSDLMAAASLSPLWTTALLAPGLVLGLFGARQAPRKLRVGLLLAFVLGMGSVRVMEWNSRKPFLRDLYSVKPGMTHAEVDAIMGRYLGGTGWPANPVAPTGTVADARGGPSRAYTSTPEGQLTLADSIVYRHTHEGWGDSDWGIVRFEGDRVAEVSFSPD